MTIDSAEAKGLVEIIQMLRDGRPRTRTDLADLTGRGRSTIANRLERLIELKLVATNGEASSTGGRPPNTFSIDTSARLAVAIDIGATHVRVALADLSANILAERRVDLGPDDGPDVVLQIVVSIVTDLLDTLQRPLTDVVGAGVGVPVSVWQPGGRPRNPPPMPGWDGVDVVSELSPLLAGVPVLVDNDANLMALGERASAHPDVSNLVFVKVATGIGAGVIADGRLIHGEDGAAGDIAHIMTPSAAGLVCRCANTGCLEAVAGGLAIQADLAAHGLPVASNADIITLARAGNAQTMTRLRAAGRDIGTVLAGYVSVMNPSLIVVGGKLAEAGEQLLAGIRESVYGHSLPQATQNLRILTSRTMGRAGVLGASHLVIDHVLSEIGLADLA